ncbi:hypothetical protein [Fodinicurvata fenggangensis]|uniref:hypothetical protein n=1 Tax=Fodinicurvata fenggangensis TaxID=1121830 RepID=UPI0012DE03ED|nr:hypothetical protein [Fodinicurvata fenggangensis]
MAIAQLAQQAFKSRGMAVYVAYQIVQSGSPSWVRPQLWIEAVEATGGLSARMVLALCGWNGVINRV